MYCVLLVRVCMSTGSNDSHVAAQFSLGIPCNPDDYHQPPLQQCNGKHGGKDSSRAAFKCHPLKTSSSSVNDTPSGGQPWYNGHANPSQAHSQGDAKVPLDGAAISRSLA